MEAPQVADKGQISAQVLELPESPTINIQELTNHVGSIKVQKVSFTSQQHMVITSKP